MDSASEDAHLAWLIARIGAGDKAAVALLYKEKAGKLLGVARRILVRQELAEEALQEAFMRIWKNAGQYDPRAGSPRAWMASIARYAAIDIRRKASQRIQDASGDLTEAEAMTDPNLHDAERAASLHDLEDCLGKLNEEQRSMVLLAYHQGFSREELATRFSRPVATVKTILRRSLASLKECLDG